MKKKLLIFSLLFMFLGVSLNAQTITGKILEEDTGLEVIGAAIVVKGTTQGTISDIDGNFRLDVPTGSNTIEISFLGFIDKEVAIDVKAGETKDLGEILLASNTIGLEELKIVASYAVDRQTPVSISKIDPILIEEKLGTQEFPEILKSTPSVYVTKQGGGYGDAEIRLRGFKSDNIGVLINGVPVNDMEWGGVYWSNWAGLSEVTRAMQVQRGLGASKLAISSVGGTINIITNSTDVEQGGTVFYGIGNNNYRKTSFTVSTGLFDNGWAITLSGARTTGDGFVNATNFEGHSYFFNVSKRISAKQQISFTGFGAPQWHNQRGSKHYLSRYMESPDGIKYNSDYGYRNGEIYNIAYAYNYYHKPQFSLNHFIKFSENTKLSTSVYASIGRGGGRRSAGSNSGWLATQYPSGEPGDAMLTSEGLYDFDAVIAANAASLTGSKCIISNSVNSHNWYGFLSSLNSTMGNIDLTFGLDGRYYKGIHFYEVHDLLGGKYFLNGTDVLYPGDRFSKDYTGEVLWEGLFAQAEYVSDVFSGFASISASNTMYRRSDYILYEEGNQVSDWTNKVGYSGKAGVNYNINDNFNVFLNGGYFQRAPYFKFVFQGSTNVFNEDAQPEKVTTGEIGIGYTSKLISANFNAYYTLWADKAYTASMGAAGTANVTGINAIHKGIELDLNSKPVSNLEITGMLSIGDWKWDDNVLADFYDENGDLLFSASIYGKDLHVGGSAQTTAALGINWDILPKVKIGADWNYYDRLFADFDITARTSPELEGIDAWLMPSYNLLDCNANYKFEIGKFKATLTGKVNNILNTEYFSDAVDGGDAFHSPLYFGAGRTWSMGLKVKF